MIEWNAATLAYSFLTVLTGVIVLFNARHAFLTGQRIPLWQVWLLPVLMGLLWPLFWSAYIWVNFIRRSK